jgi:Flp pilus assembly protein TadG
MMANGRVRSVPVRDEAGQSMVEMALLLPVLFLLFMGILEFGRAFTTRQAVTHAAREGARRAVVFDPVMNQDSVKAAIAGALSRAGIPGAAVTIAFDEASSPDGHWRETGALQTVYVGVQYRFGFFGPLVKAVTGSESMTLSSLVTMRNE